MFFKKSRKFYFEAIFSRSSLNLAKNEFYWKKGLRQFLNVPIIYHPAKSQKKTNSKESYGIFQKFHYTREHQNLQTKKRLRNFYNKEISSQMYFKYI